jgi:hypothetical protein
MKRRYQADLRTLADEDKIGLWEKMTALDAFANTAYLWHGPP